jgi:hypothetical protein
LANPHGCIYFYIKGIPKKKEVPNQIAGLFNGIYLFAPVLWAFLPSGRFFVLYLLGGIGSSTLKKTLEHTPGYDKSLLARMEPTDIHDRYYKNIWATKAFSSSPMSVDFLRLFNLNSSI